MNYVLPLVGLCVVLSSCGGNTESGAGASFGAPVISDIVDAVVPSQLKSSVLLLSNLGGPSILACPIDGSFTSDCNASAAGYITFLQSGVFKQATASNVAGPQYYRYWVDVVDAALAETNERLAGNSEAPACLSETATEVNFVFPVNGADVTVSPKLQCWENQGATPNGGSQDFAFGKDENYYYLVYRTFDNCVDNGCGTRFLLAKASVDGNQADIWSIGTSKQSGNDSVNAQRILADKGTGAFTFNHVEDPINNTGIGFSSFYGNTDGTKVYMEATVAIAGDFFDVPGFEPTAGWCASVSDITTETAAACGDTDRSTLPATIGLTIPMAIEETAGNSLTRSWVNDGTEKTEFLTALSTIGDMDLSAAGVTEWTSGSAQ